MHATGFAHGKKAAIYSPNHPGAFDALLGLYRAGGAWVPVHYRDANHRLQRPVLELELADGLAADIYVDQNTPLRWPRAAA